MLADEEIDKFVSDQVPNNTKKKTKSDVQLFERWLESIPGEIRSVEEIPPVELNKLLRNFYLTVRKQKSNEEYEPDTLVSIKNSIDRYLTEKGYGYSLSRSEEFKTSRDVLSAKGKQLKKDGRGRRSNRADEVSPEEEKKLWDLGVMGKKDPHALTRAIWWRNNFFGFRGRDEHRKLKWGDITIREEVDGTRYMMFEERDTKTRKTPSDVRSVNPRLYETKDKPETCPVNLMLEYTHRRPICMCEPESPFYLQVHQSWNKTGTDQPAQVWYKDQPLGEHSLGNMMKEMARDGGLPGRKTNHSGRKTTVKRLKEAGFENTDIMQVTGHKNVQSLNSYCTVPNKTMKKMSETLTECDEDTENAEFSDIPDDELSEILGAIENIEQIHPSQVSSTETGGISDIQMSSSNTLNKAFGLGTSMLSGANISGGSFVFNINFNSQ